MSDHVCELNEKLVKQSEELESLRKSKVRISELCKVGIDHMHLIFCRDHGVESEFCEHMDSLTSVSTTSGD